MDIFHCGLVHYLHKFGSWTKEIDKYYLSIKLLRIYPELTECVPNLLSDKKSADHNWETNIQVVFISTSIITSFSNLKKFMNWTKDLDLNSEFLKKFNNRVRRAVSSVFTTVFYDDERGNDIDILSKKKASWNCQVGIDKKGIHCFFRNSIWILWKFNSISL